MKENEAIKFLKGKYPSWGCDEDEYENAQTAIKALEELQAYRAIGTVEECRNAVERMKPKKPIFKTSIFKCPSCGSVNVEENSEVFCPDKYDYCPDCGQKLEWNK